MDQLSAKTLINWASWNYSFKVLVGLWTSDVHKTDAHKVLNDRLNLPESLADKAALDFGALNRPCSLLMGAPKLEIIS